MQASAFKPTEYLTRSMGEMKVEGGRMQAGMPGSAFSSSAAPSSGSYTEPYISQSDSGEDVYAATEANGSEDHQKQRKKSAAKKESKSDKSVRIKSAPAEPQADAGKKKRSTKKKESDDSVATFSSSASMIGASGLVTPAFPIMIPPPPGGGPYEQVIPPGLIGQPMASAQSLPHERHHENNESSSDAEAAGNKGSFVCDVCSKQFVTKGSLKTHGMIHRGERPFSCPLCSKSFTQQANCARHIRLMHPDAPQGVLPIKLNTEPVKAPPEPVPAPETKKSAKKGTKSKNKGEVVPEPLSNKSQSNITPQDMNAVYQGPGAGMYMYQSHIHPYAAAPGVSPYAVPPPPPGRPGMSHLIHRSSSNDSFLSLDMAHAGPINGLLTPPPPPPQKPGSKKRKKEEDVQEPVESAPKSRKPAKQSKNEDAVPAKGKKSKKGYSAVSDKEASESAAVGDTTYGMSHQQQQQYAAGLYLPAGGGSYGDWQTTVGMKPSPLIGSPSMQGNASAASYQQPPPISLEWSRAKSPVFPAPTSASTAANAATGQEWVMRSKSPLGSDVSAMFHASHAADAGQPQQQSSASAATQQQYYFYGDGTPYQLPSPNSQRAAAFAHQQQQAAAAAAAKYYPQQQSQQQQTQQQQAQQGEAQQQYYAAYGGYPMYYAAAGAQPMMTGGFEGAEGYAMVDPATGQHLDMVFDPSTSSMM